MHNNSISVIIINHNGNKFLKTCLSSLLSTDYSNFEVIFVDNGSTDGSLDYIKKEFNDNRIRIVQLDKNMGVPGGRNVGFEVAKGEYIVFLDNDTEVDKGWLKGLIETFETDSRIAVAQSKLLNMVERDKFDHAGDYLTPFGFLFERSNQAKDRGQFDKIEDILNAKGAATMIKSMVFRELGMYDESYFMYQEETDFCFRVWLAGYRVVFAPKSKVWHAFSTPLKDTKAHYSNYIIKYYGSRNYITTLLKNLCFTNIIRIVPIHTLCWLGLCLSFIIRLRFADAYFIIRGVLWNLFNVFIIIKKRRFVQNKIRKIRDKEFMDKVMAKMPLNFYFKKAKCYIRGVPFE